MIQCGRLATIAITIFAIAGTLSGCGRYGSPVRVAPVESDAAIARMEPLDSEAIASTTDESSDRRDADDSTDRIE
jgi:hypothetical protein